MILSFAVVAGFFFAAVITGLSVVGRLVETEKFSYLERGLLAFGTGSLAAFFAVWGVGSFVYTSASMWALFGVWLIGSVAAFMVRVRRDPLALSAFPALNLSRFPENLWWALFLVLALLTLLSGLAPPADYDSLNYHIQLPKRDLEFGRIIVVANDRIMEGFPAMLEILYRFALATAGDGAAQMIHGLFGITAALGTYCLALRLAGDRGIAIVAAVMFLAVRVVVFEAGTTHNDLGLALYFVLALIVYMGWRERGRVGSMALFGLMIGAMCNVKYQGLFLASGFAPAMFFDWWVRRCRLNEACVGVMTSVVIFAPWLVRNYVAFGNPVAPIFSSLFPNSDPVMQIALSPKVSGLGDGIVWLLRSPWDIFILGEQFYDGQIFGAPYLLIFMPMAYLAWRTLRNPWLPIVISGFYYVIWFFVLFHQIRFLIPIFPVFAAFSAIGAMAYWQTMKLRTWSLALAVGISLLLALNQSMFVGVYAALRVPAAVGFVDKKAYLTETPTIDFSVYAACTFITDTLRNGERYLSFLNSPRSYYCPQQAAIYDLFEDERIAWRRRARPFPKPSAIELTARFDNERIRLIIVPTILQDNGALSNRPAVQKASVAHHRFGKLISPLLARLEPAFVGRNAVVYWGADVKAALAAIAGG